MSCKRLAAETDTGQNVTKRVRPLILPEQRHTNGSGIPRGSKHPASSSVMLDSHERVAQLTPGLDEHDGDADERITIGGPRKPDMRSLPSSLEGLEAMRSKLDTFLPQLALSNKNLRDEDSMEQIDFEDGHGQHISMELACGVLEKSVDLDGAAFRDGDVVLPRSKHGHESTDDVAESSREAQSEDSEADVTDDTDDDDESDDSHKVNDENEADINKNETNS